MLAEALGTEAQELDRAGADALSGCERAVFVGGVYAGGVAGLQKFAKLLSGGSVGRAAVLCVGASPYDEGAIAQLRGRCRALDENVPLFYAARGLGRGENVAQGQDDVRIASEDGCETSAGGDRALDAGAVGRYGAKTRLGKRGVFDAAARIHERINRGPRQKGAALL